MSTTQGNKNTQDSLKARKEAIQSDITVIEHIAQRAWRAQYTHLDTKQLNTLMNYTRKVAEVLDYEVKVLSKFIPEA